MATEGREVVYVDFTRSQKCAPRELNPRLAKKTGDLPLRLLARLSIWNRWRVWRPPFSIGLLWQRVEAVSRGLLLTFSALVAAFSRSLLAFRGCDGFACLVIRACHTSTAFLNYLRFKGAGKCRKSAKLASFIYLV